MEEVSIIGIDLAKRSFQAHGAKADGSVAYRRKLSRGKLLGFLASQPPAQGNSDRPRADAEPLHEIREGVVRGVA